MPHPPAVTRRRLSAGVALAMATAWVAWSAQRGIGFVENHPGMRVNPTGFVGGLHPRWHPATWWTVAVAIALVTVAPAVVRREGRWVPAGVASVCAGTWTWALAAPEGWAGFTRSLEHRSEYRVIVPLIESPGRFVDTYVSRLEEYTIHVKGHPPGMTLVLWTLDRLGADSVRAEALFLLGCVVLSAAGLVLMVQRLADRSVAAAVAPFVGIAPAAVFMTSNADVFFTTVIVFTTLAAAIAATSPRRSVPAAAAAGVGAGAALFLTYGAPLMLIGAGVLIARTRRPAAIIAAVAGTGGVTAAFTMAGFWWFDGLDATRGYYEAGVAMRRPFTFFVVANIAVALVAMGPATVAGVATLRDRRLWWIVGPALVGLILADLSGLSKAEVERIWLPFYALMTVAVADLCPTRSTARIAMGSQLALGLALQTVLTTPW